MTKNKALSIKNWIKSMGFKLTKSHLLEHRTRKIKYYTLENFGVYEEIIPFRKSSSASVKTPRFISWTPWGDNIEITSVKELSKAYEEFMDRNPAVLLN
jgi:hypothetical protein